MEKMRQWSILTAVGVVAVMVAGWFLLVSPQRSHAADVRTQASAQESANASLKSRVDQLEQQKKGLPAQTAKLKKFDAQVPDNPELPALIRQLSAAAKGSGVELVSLAPGQPALVTATSTTTTGVTTSASTTTSSSATGTTPAAPAASPLAAIPLTVNVQGGYYNIESFFRAVEHLTRAMLVPGWTLCAITPTGSSAPTGGASCAVPSTGASDKALPAGTLNGVITAYVFESPQVAAAATAPVTPVAPQ
jgi:type IV pilus assembly protein PilO